MRIFHDQDADLALLHGKHIAVIGYGNQGRAQALNLRDSGLDVVIGNREDEYAERGRKDGFMVLSIGAACQKADIVMMLIPDDVMPDVFDSEVVPGLEDGTVLSFASGYTVAFESVLPPSQVDVILVAPRMIGAGVRDKYVEGNGFPAFVGVHQDPSGRAKEIALALAKGIGATRFGVAETTFVQEAELDLFTEQCFGPAFGHVLTTAVDLLLEEGYPPEAVLLELYMSGEFSYTLQKIAELGMVEQTALHSPCSQYGSMSRGMRFMLPDLRERMRQGLDEIRSGQFAREWAAEQAAGCPTVGMLREAAQQLPLYQLERELRAALRGETYEPQADAAQPSAVRERAPTTQPAAEPTSRRSSTAPAGPTKVATGGILARLLGLWDRLAGRTGGGSQEGAMNRVQLEAALRRFVASAAADPALQSFAQGRSMTSHYILTDVGLEFYLRFTDRMVEADMGPPRDPADVRLETTADTLDGMFTGRVNAMRAAMTGRLQFKGEAKVAMGLQQVQADLSRLYIEARRSGER
jgi:ketol-acid reductoisomerase